MIVLIYEDNLMWSARLRQSVVALGHQAVVLTSAGQDVPDAQAAIVNLGSSTIPPDVVVPLLQEKGVHVIGHAGHKEKPLAKLGNDLGCDQVVSNSSLTFHLANLLEKASNSA